MEMGTHDELLGQEGLYASLLHKQGLGMAAKHAPPPSAVKDHAGVKGRESEDGKDAGESKTLMDGGARKGADQQSLPSRHREQAVAVVLDAGDQSPVITGTGASAAPTPTPVTA